MSQYNTPDINNTPDIKIADAVKGHWADRLLPQAMRPYARLARLERPIGWWLLMWPCWWSSVLATSTAGDILPNFWHLFLFMMGAIAMRGAGCVYNDIVDRDLDAHVERTRLRPIPSGQVSVQNAILFMVGLSFLGLIVLLQFNNFTIALGMASLAIIATYPFMKRIMDWPQFVLGMAFSWGAFLGWAAIYGQLNSPVFFLYGAGISWTLFYDTIYAYQDHEDDAIVGIRSTARLFASHNKIWLASFSILSILFFALAFVMANCGFIAFLGLAIGSLHFAWQIFTLDTSRTENCLIRFRSNRNFGWVIFFGLMIDAMVKNGLLSYFA